MPRKPKRTAKTPEFLRPPIVTIMGHVDHGKTTLLDYIRKTNVVKKEAGGITQHIGAYQVAVGDKKITFIDTPGHEAFAKMRARGAQVTDIVVLLVAANDGVMPQTIESIGHIKAAKTLYIVALNKVDLPEADIEKVKRQLAKNDVLVEGYGGDIVCVPVSAKTGKGVKDLLEMILLTAEMNPKNFSANPKGELEAYVIESKMDKRVGPLVTVLVKNGTLKVKDEIIIETIKGKIKAMKNERGEKIDEAGPSTPVVILGLEKIPPVGARIIIIKETREKGGKKETGGETKEERIKKEGTGRLRIILKADTVGSLEALSYSLPENLEIFEKGVGDISESEILLAKTVGAIVLGFNVGVSKEVEKLAETEKVLVKTYNIIYQLLDEINDVIAELEKPKPTEKILGIAKIIADFSGTTGRIAGCKVTEGRITKSDNLRIEREKKVIGDNLKIASMKQVKKDVDKVSMGMECGLILSPEVDFRIGDMLISYRKLE